MSGVVLRSYHMADGVFKSYVLHEVKLLMHFVHVSGGFYAVDTASFAAHSLNDWFPCTQPLRSCCSG